MKRTDTMPQPGTARRSAREDFLIGCHLSSSKGFLSLQQTMESLGANTFQYFSRNPRGSRQKKLDLRDRDAFLSRRQALGHGPFVAHAPYTLNLASASEAVRSFGRQVLFEDLRRMEEFPGNFYNLHPGSHVGAGLQQGIHWIREALCDALPEAQNTIVLLETMAGQGTQIGRSFEELAAILNDLPYGQRLGVCLDTCHVHDAGYDLVSDLEGVLETFDRIIGLSRLRAIHLNDSQNPLGSKKDRHAALGEGFLGWGSFERIINHPALRSLPFLLETPNNLSGYAKEIAALIDRRTP
ncbi:Endonuclease IV [Clostridiaceae bacterium JG1575]|nr:Endonuclease IV [Clostridiaceae bacterium JG1575]